MIIAIDFDGTCARHEYPEIGADVPYVVEVLLKLQAAGHQLILWTMCHDHPYLEAACEWFRTKDIKLWAININPEQAEWTSSPKVFANLYIDDATLGCPLITPTDGRPYVNWPMVDLILQKRGYYEPVAIELQMLPLNHTAAERKLTMNRYNPGSEEMGGSDF